MSAPCAGISVLAVIGQPAERRDNRADSPGVFFSRLDRVSIDPTSLIEALVTIDAGINQSTVIGARSWLMKKVHVGHDAQIGDDCEIAPMCSVGGFVRIGNRVKVGQGAIFKPRVTVGDDAVIGCGAVVIRDVPVGETWAGNPAKPVRRLKATGETLTELEEQGWEEVATRDEQATQAWEEWWTHSRS